MCQLVRLMVAAACGICLRQATKPPFYDEIQAFVRADRQNPPARGQILFVGSSSFALWTDMQKDFPNHRILNRGFGGSSLPDVIRYADQIIFPYQPAQIVIYCGENDFAAADNPSVSTVEQRFLELYRIIRQRLPRVPILYISIKPSPVRRNLWPKFVSANRRIQSDIKNERYATFVDVYSLMLDANGQPRTDLYREDQLHMNSAGYAIWVKALEPLLIKP